MMHEPSPCTIYFLRPVGQEGPIKIGASRFPDDRVLAYAKWSPIQLEIAARIKASFKVEKQFHALFRDQLSHHEWFHVSPEMTAVIDAINAGTFDLESLPRGINLYQSTTFPPSRYRAAPAPAAA